jgi:hypothetical protein
MNTRKTPASSNSTHTPLPLPENLEQRIRQRAYELYLQRGQEEGHAEQDWLNAEQEILSNTKSQPAAA